MEMLEGFDPRDRWLALATESFARELADDERDELRSLGRAIDSAHADAIERRLDRLRRQLDAPRPGALHHTHPVTLEREQDAEGIVPCDMLACWLPREVGS